MSGARPKKISCTSVALTDKVKIVVNKVSKKSSQMPKICKNQKISYNSE